MSRAKLWVIAGDVEAVIAGEPFDGDRQMFNGSDHQGRPHYYNRSRTRWSTSACCAQPPRSDRYVFAFDAPVMASKLMASRITAVEGDRNRTFWSDYRALPTFASFAGCSPRRPWRRKFLRRRSNTRRGHVWKSANGGRDTIPKSSIDDDRSQWAG